MIAMFGVIETPALVRYVNLVGQAVAQYAPRQVPYRFGILDSDIVGAFALPGGFIFITKTAIEGMTNEAQLAGALGHEVVHVSSGTWKRRSGARRIQPGPPKRPRPRHPPRWRPIISKRRPTHSCRRCFNMRLSRDKEDGSDERGTLMAAQAGTPPVACWNFYARCSKSAPNLKPARLRTTAEHASILRRTHCAPGSHRRQERQGRKRPWKPASAAQ